MPSSVIYINWGNAMVSKTRHDPCPHGAFQRHVGRPNEMAMQNISNEILLSISRVISWKVHYKARTFWRINAN